jgi:hypothetical protein
MKPKINMFVRAFLPPASAALDGLSVMEMTTSRESANTTEVSEGSNDCCPQAGSASGRFFR